MSRPLLVIGAIALAVYINAVAGGFVLDDKLLQRDPRVLGQTSFWTIFVTDYWNTGSRDLYRPIATASYALNALFFGMSAAGFHLVNVLLHALVCGVVFLLVDALLGERSLAVATALLFATHPVHTEAVTGIVGRTELLAALFLLVALYLHTRDYALGGRDRRTWLPAALLAYFCALLSKETAIVGVGLVLVVDLVKQMRTREGKKDDSRRSRDTWRNLSIVGCYVAVALLYVSIRYAVLGRLIQKPPPRSYLLLFGQPLMTQLYTALEILAVYLRLLLFPLWLSADYSYRQVPLLDAPEPAALLGIVGLAAIVGLVVWAWRRRAAPPFFAAAFFVVAYAVVSNFPVPLQVLVAERVMYLPSVGFCVALAWLLGRLAIFVGERGATTAHVALVVVLALYAGRTLSRNVDWQDAEHLYAATVRTSPECHAAHFNYAAVLMQRGTQNDLALHHLERAYEIRQDHYPTLVNLSAAYLQKGQLDRAREVALQGAEMQPNSKQIKSVLDAIEKSAQARKPAGIESPAATP